MDKTFFKKRVTVLLVKFCSENVNFMLSSFDWTLIILITVLKLESRHNIWEINIDDEF